jgi:hypothetical protein
MPIENGKCSCGASAVKTAFVVHDYEGWHTGPNNDRKCRHSLSFAIRPFEDGGYAHVLCPACGEENAQFRASGSHPVQREVCPAGCP